MIKPTEVDRIFKLEKNTIDPRFEGFGFDSEESIRGKSRINADFMPDDIPTSGRNWTVTRMSQSWTPQHVSGRVRAYNDYPCVNLIIPAFSERAVKILGDMLEPNGELLPLVSSIGLYYAYNTTTIADVLNTKKSKIDWFKDKSIILPFRIIKHEFYSESVDDLSIFRIVEDPAGVYVTNLFVDRIKKNHLKGFAFQELWSCADAPDQVTSDHEELAEAESLVVQFIKAPSQNVGKNDRKNIQNILDYIDFCIFSAERDGVYLGSLEGHKVARRSIDVMFSCPSSEKLAEYLAPRLLKITWDGSLSFIKRFGSLDSIACSEIRVALL